MKTKKTTSTFKRPFDLLVMFFKQRFCSHVFRGPDMGRRNEQGILAWPCSKCGKVYEFEYGLQAQEHGKILGPWGT